MIQQNIPIYKILALAWTRGQESERWWLQKTPHKSNIGQKSIYWNVTCHAMKGPNTDNIDIQRINKNEPIFLEASIILHMVNLDIDFIVCEFGSTNIHAFVR